MNEWIGFGDRVVSWFSGHHLVVPVEKGEQSGGSCHNPGDSR